MYRDKQTYEAIIRTIIDIYLDYDIRTFPINEKDVCKKLGVSLVPYSAFNEGERALLIDIHKKGYFVRESKETPPTIYYNDLLDSYGSVRFTVFHEIKHYVYDEDESDEDIDDHADFFSRYFQCPIPFLMVKGITKINEIVSFCNVSMEVAKNVRSNLRNRMTTYGYKIFDYEIPLLKHLDKDAYKAFIKEHRL